MKSPTTGIKPMPKSETMFICIFLLNAGGRPPSIWSALCKSWRAKSAAITSPIHGISPMIPAHPIRMPQRLNCKSSLYAFLLTEFKIFKSCFGMISGNFLFLFAPFRW